MFDTRQLKAGAAAGMLALALALGACGPVGVQTGDGGTTPAANTAATGEAAAGTTGTQAPTTATTPTGEAAQATEPTASAVAVGGGGEEETPAATPAEDDAQTTPADAATTEPAEEETATPPEEETPEPEATTEPEAEPTAQGTVPPSDVTYGEATPLATATPKSATATVSRAVLVSGKPDRNATKGKTKFTLKDRQISLVGEIANAPEYGSLEAKWEVLEIGGRQIDQKIRDRELSNQFLSLRGANPFVFTINFQLENPPDEGKYQVSLTLDDRVIKRIPFTIEVPEPRLIGKPGKSVGGGTGRLKMVIPKNTEVWEYKVYDEDLQEVVSQYGNSLQYEETPGVHQLPAGRYLLAISPSIGSGDPGLYQIEVAAGRETAVQLGALRLNSGQVPDRLVLVDTETGRPAGSEYGGDREDSLLQSARALPPGRYEVYFRSNTGEQYLKVGEVVVKPGVTATLNV